MWLGASARTEACEWTASRALKPVNGWRHAHDALLPRLERTDGGYAVQHRVRGMFSHILVFARVHPAELALEVHANNVRSQQALAVATTKSRAECFWSVLAVALYAVSENCPRKASDIEYILKINREGGKRRSGLHEIDAVVDEKARICIGADDRDLHLLEHGHDSWVVALAHHSQGNVDELCAKLHLVAAEPDLVSRLKHRDLKLGSESVGSHAVGHATPDDSDLGL